MTDIPQALASYDALVGVALGAGLTYGFGALNRRHQEKRENETRWYEARFQAYSELSKALLLGQRLARKGKTTTEEQLRELILAIESAGGMTRLVGSEEVLDTLVPLFNMRHDPSSDERQFLMAVARFEAAARKDLGHPPIEH